MKNKKNQNRRSFSLLSFLIIALLACMPLTAQFSIGGDFTVTINTTETYQLNGPSRNSVNWNVTRGTIQSSSNSSVTIRWTSTGSGSVGAQVFYGSNSTFTGRGVTISNPGPPLLLPGGITGAQSICYSGNPSTLTSTSGASGGTGAYSYQWQYSNSGSSGWTNISGATSTTYNPPSGLTTSRWYRRRVISGTQTKYTNTVKVTVGPTLIPGSINGAATICFSGNPLTINSQSLAYGGNGSYTYQWQYSNNGSSGWTNIGSAAATTYNPPSGLTSSRWYRRRAISCGETKYTNTVKITVSPILTSGSINGEQTICSSGNPTTLGSASNAGGGNGSYTYQWQYSNNGSSSWTNISGATATSYNPPSGLTTSRSYRRRVISCGETRYTNTVVVTVRPTLIPGSISGGGTICYGGDPLTINNGTLALGGDASYAYQWQYSNNGSSGWANITGANSSSYNPPSGLTASRWYRRRVVSCGETKYTNTINVTVNPTLNPGSINGTATICYGDDPATLGNASAATGGNGSYSYQWQYSNNGSSGWTNIGSATATTYNPPSGLTASRWYRRRAISCGETKYTNTAQITVSPPITGGSINGAQSVCYDGNPTTLGNTSGAAGGDGSYAYQWQYSNNGSNGWVNISGATATTYNPPSGLTSSRWYRRSAVSCGDTAYSNTVQVAVSAALVAGNISGSASLCSGGNPGVLGNVSGASGGNGSYSYQWQYSNNGTSGWTNITGATSNSYDPPSGLTTSRWYRRGVTSCGDTQYTSAVNIAISPALIAGSITGDATICNGENPDILGSASSATGGDGSYAYQWQYSNNGASGWTNITGATSTTYDPSSNLTASRWYRRGAASCGTTLYSNTVEISVRPALGIPTAVDTITHCGGGTVALTASTGSNSDQIHWYTAATGGTFLGEGTYDAPASNATYYAASYNSTTLCESTSRKAISVSISATITWYLDADGDGHASLTQDSCTSPGEGYTQEMMPVDDCNDDIYDPANNCSGSVAGNLNISFSGNNYVYTRNYQTELTVAPGFFAENDDLIQEITYVDGLGRSTQQISIDQSPGKNDIITHFEYDGFNRMGKEYLPYPTTDGALATLRDGAKAAIEEYYNNPKYESTSNPFSEKSFENSPLNSVTQQAAPGNVWAIGQGHEIAFTYETNVTSDAVKRFEVTTTLTTENGVITYLTTLDDNGTYLEGELYKNITYDENHSGTDKNHSVEEYSNKEGLVVLKRTYADITNGDGSVSAAEPHDTYYVYDDYGNLSFVLPPKVDVSDGVSPIELSELCYQYTYDHRNRLVVKKLPGKEEEYIVYNKLDQPIMTQDANQRLINEWLFTKYDAFGRVALTGKAVSPGSRTVVQNQANTTTLGQWVTQYGQGSSSQLGGATYHYNNAAYPLSSITEILTINYYDDYVDAPAGAPGAVILLGSASEGNNLNIKGLPTVSRVKVLDVSPEQWVNTLTYYDDKGRAIYTYSENEYLQTVDVVETELDFVGRPLKVKTTHTRNGNTIVTIDNFNYDHVGRLLSQTQCIGDGTLGDSCPTEGVDVDLPLTGSITTNQVATQSITISPTATISGTVSLQIDPNAVGGSGAGTELIVFNDYDELGQLEAKKVGGATANSYTAAIGLQTVDYTYNVRGWLTGINDTNDNDATLTPGVNDLFAFRIGYNEGGNALFNGNIALTQWQTQSTDDATLKQYDYTYDALNRIKTGIDNTGKFNLANVGYDKNGNITALTRLGHVEASPILNDGSDTDYGTMDVLDYGYHNGEVSNRLFKVRDDGNKTYGFKDGTGDTQDYWYDANGNMVRDLNKGIGNSNTDGITYNHLNLPTNITIDGGSIAYIYDATGVKMQKTTSSNTTTDYAGNYVYENNTLAFMSHPEGYSTPKNTANLAQGFDYIYRYKDHLGNVRLSYTEDPSNPGTPTIIEGSNYYPFGGLHKGYNEGGDTALGNDVAQKWKYNGKELNEELGLDWYDYGARNYDASLGRWMNMDKKAEFYVQTSPYVYALNTPVNAIDPDGNLVIFVNGYFSRIGSLANLAPSQPLQPYWDYFSEQFIPAARDFLRATADEGNYFVDGSSYFGGDQSGSDRFENGYEYAVENYTEIVSQLAEGETLKFVGHSEGSAFAAGMMAYFLDRAETDDTTPEVESSLHLSPDEADEFALREHNGLDFQIHNENDPVSPFMELQGADFIFKENEESFSAAHGSTVSRRAINRLRAAIQVFINSEDTEEVETEDGTLYRRTRN